MGSSSLHQRDFIRELMLFALFEVLKFLFALTERTGHADQQHQAGLVRRDRIQSIQPAANRCAGLQSKPRKSLRQSKLLPELNTRRTGPALRDRRLHARNRRGPELSTRLLSTGRESITS